VACCDTSIVLLGCYKFHLPKKKKKKKTVSMNQNGLEAWNKGLGLKTYIYNYIYALCFLLDTSS
jgi:hypothetical protein